MFHDFREPVCLSVTRFPPLKCHYFKCMPSLCMWDLYRFDGHLRTYVLPNKTSNGNNCMLMIPNQKWTKSIEHPLFASVATLNTSHWTCWALDTRSCHSPALCSLMSPAIVHFHWMVKLFQTTVWEMAASGSVIAKCDALAPTKYSPGLCRVVLTWYGQEAGGDQAEEQQRVRHLHLQAGGRVNLGGPLGWRLRLQTCAGRGEFDSCDTFLLPTGMPRRTRQPSSHIQRTAFQRACGLPDYVAL